MNPATAQAPENTAARKRRPATPKVKCEDCFFAKNMLCALAGDKPCPTFRPADQGLAPPQQLAFTFRQERTRSAWAFSQPE